MINITHTGVNWLVTHILETPRLKTLLSKCIKDNNIFIKDVLELMFKEIKYTDLQVSYMMQWYFELKQRHLSNQ